MKKFLLSAIMLNITGMAAADINPGKTYRIASAANEKRTLFVENAALANNKPVVLWTDTEVPAQQWTAQSNGDGTYSLVNVFTGQYLSRNSSGITSSTKLRQTTSSTNMTKWTLKEVAGQDNKYVILQTHASKDYMLSTDAAKDGISPSYTEYDDGASTDPKNTWILTEVEPITGFDASICTKIADAWISQHLRNRGNNKATFGNGGGWGDAEMLETMLDAYETTGDKKYLDTFTMAFNYFKEKVGTDWLKLVYNDQYKWYGHDFNDDVMWMIIASARAYLLTGSSTYRTYAKNNFDKIFDRAYNEWGMLRWAENSGNKNGTNSCINGPAEVAACYLALGLTNETEKEEYYDIARSLYEKQRRYLFNAQTGEVYDSFTWDAATNMPGSYNHWVSTYNQGTMLGAAVMLYNHYGDERYKQDADRIVSRTRSGLCNSDGIISACQTVDGDLCGFKGILMRYLRRYIVDLRHPELVQWLKDNAFFAYNNRNSKGIISSAWLSKSTENMVSLTEKNNEGQYKSFANQPFGNSTALSAAANASIDSNDIIKDAWSKIEAESCDYFKGIFKTDSKEGNGKEVSGIKNTRYTIYNNVDFGSRTARSIELRVGNVASDNASVDIYLDDIFGTKIGNAVLPKGEGYQTVSAAIAPTDGMRNICLVYRANMADTDCFTLDWFKFGSETPALYNDITDGEGAIFADNCKNDKQSLIDNLPTTETTVEGQSAVFTYISIVPAKLRAYTITSSASDAKADPKSWTIEASTDAKTWITIAQESDKTFEMRSQTKEFAVSADKAFNYFRLKVDANNGAQVTSLGEWQLIGEAVSTHDITADGGKLSTENRSLIDKDLNSYVTSKADDNEHTYNAKGLYTLSSYSITSASKDNAPRKWTLYGKANSDWIVIDSQTSQSFHSNRCTQFYKVNTQEACQSFKLVVSTDNGNADIAEWQLFGHTEAATEMYADITDNGGRLSSSATTDESVLSSLFDNDAQTTVTLPFNGETWIQYVSEIPVKLNAIRIVGGYDNDRNPKSWKFEASDNGSDWTTVVSRSNQTFRTKGAVNVSTTTNTKLFRFFKLTVSQASSENANEIVIGDIQIHGQAIADSDITNAEGIKTAEMPGMNDGEAYEKLFDRNVDSKYVMNYYGTAWMDYESKTPVKMNVYSITSGNDEVSRDPKSWELQASDNGRDWTTLDKRTSQYFYGRKTTQFYTVNNTGAYRHYRLQLLENNGNKLAQMSEWQMFYSEKVATGIGGIATGGDVAGVAYDRNADVLRVALPSTAKVYVYNTNGQVAASHSLEAGNHELPFASMAKGIYVVKVVTGNGATSAKIVK